MVPPGICNIPAGSGGDAPGTEADCRIGHDTNLSMYSAQNYPWIQHPSGNVYDCPVPACAKTTGAAVVNPVSKVVCK